MATPFENDIGSESHIPSNAQYFKTDNFTSHFEGEQRYT